MTEILASLRYCSDLFAYRRRRTRVVRVGTVGVGGDNPIRVQSMTTTDTLNAEATIAQTLKMVEAGCELVRITAPTVEDARALGKIKQGLLSRGVDVPLVADIHFSPAAAMEAADYVEKVRINPGNFVDTKRFAAREYTDLEYKAELERIEERFTPLVQKLKRLKRALRIGTNHGSLSDRIMNRYGDSPLGMVESALEFVWICEKSGYHDIVLSMKSSNPKVMIAAYRLLAARMEDLEMDYPFHLGVTEAGGGEDGRIKSAIGIGSLLADGIGDTIRVSLTEDPELEVPVCQALAKPFQDRPGEAVRPGSSGLAYCADAFSYARRKARALEAGPFAMGASQVVRVMTPTAPGAGPEALLARLEAQLKKAKGAEPELLEWNVAAASDVDGLARARAGLSGETSRLAFVARCEGSEELAAKVLAHADALCLLGEPSAGLLRAVAERGVPLFLEAADADEAARVEARAREFGVFCALGLAARADTTRSLQEYRLMAARVPNAPVLIRAPKDLLEASVLVGSLLCDGVGDVVRMDAPLETIYAILQGAGVRVTRTEFVSCPSCGRTLFDLQSTTERIKSKTGHLKGVKIAIMGCIVNGPGEMADADFGYVGGAPERINLYVGRDCVQKGIPSDQADQALIDLIKKHGKWIDPA